MKKLIIMLILLSHSFFAMADDNSSKNELLHFIKENNITVGSYHGANPFSGVFDNNNLIIDDFDKIDLVSFRDKNITTIPSTLSTLPNLVRIILNNVNLESFPKIDTLRYLEFSNIDFDRVSDDVFKNSKLNGLIIENSKITSLSSDIGNLIDLKVLELENAQLKKLPKEFENLVNLGTLNLNNNQIEELPNTLLQLGYLFMKNNNLKKLPDNFGDNTYLKYLDLSNNKLKELPNSFINLKELQDLYLNNNQIEKLPKDFFTIFEKKHISYAHSRSGPHINISNNKISFFDKSVCEAFKLSAFKFYGNYFDELPPCLNSDAIDAYTYDGKIYYSNYISGILDINGTKPIGSYKIRTKDFLKSAGWKFAKDVLIDYSYKDDKTISFDYILGDDINITSYLWNFGDGKTSTFTYPIHPYSNYGDYNVTLTLNKGEFNISKLISIQPRVLKLTKGWNMITPPTKDDINASLFEKVWNYDTNSTLWNNNHTFLTPTVGYWVKINEDLNYSYSGEVYKLPNYKIKKGWNLVGSGEKYFKGDDNLTLWNYKSDEWFLNPKEINVGSAFWIKK